MTSYIIDISISSVDVLLLNFLATSSTSLSQTPPRNIELLLCQIKRRVVICRKIIFLSQIYPYFNKEIIEFINNILYILNNRIIIFSKICWKILFTMPINHIIKHIPSSLIIIFMLDQQFIVIVFFFCVLIIDVNLFFYFLYLSSLSFARCLINSL